MHVEDREFNVQAFHTVQYLVETRARLNTDP